MALISEKNIFEHKVRVLTFSTIFCPKYLSF